MNIIKTTLFALATLASIGASAQKNNWQLVWHEEFNEDGKLNEKIWNYENGFVRNHEDQWYQADNAWCERGLLIIEGRTEKRPNPCLLYTSSFAEIALVLGTTESSCRGLMFKARAKLLQIINRIS